MVDPMVMGDEVLVSVIGLASEEGMCPVPCSGLTVRRLTCKRNEYTAREWRNWQTRET